MWKTRNGFEHSGGASAVIALLVLTYCSSAALPQVVEEEELVRPAEPLEPETAAEMPPAAAATGEANRIHSLELRSEGSEAVLEVVAGEPMVWLSQREGEKRLVIELPGTFPGPDVEEIATFEGLVAAVLFEADESEPRTRIIVLTRGPALTSLMPLGDRLRIKLSPAEPAADLQAAAEMPPAPEPAPEPIPPTVPPPDDPPAGEPSTRAPSAVRPTSGEEIGDSIFEIQLGLFSEEDNATEWAADLQRRGYPAYVVEVTNSKGLGFHTVRLGPYGTRQQARRAAAEYRDREGGESLIRWRPRPPADER